MPGKGQRRREGGAGRRTQAVFERLREFESRNVTYLDPDGTWPVVWERARGCQVWDVEGRRYLDLTAAFGVAAAGHANARVVRAGQRQMARLLHAMGDVHPHRLKADLARELSRLTFERWAAAGFASGATGGGRTLFCNSGFEAVEAALKTAHLAGGRAGVVAFEGAYHGLGYGALNATHRPFFRSPFRRQLREFATFVEWPVDEAGLERVERAVNRALAGGRIGAVLVEPVQGRGGIRVPPKGFLRMLRGLCDAHGVRLIFDEVYTGFGRTGRWFAGEHEAVVPDVICLGKALTGGFPLSACVGRAELMDAAWPMSEGEALHTSTFLGHPVGCAMALAQVREIEGRRLVDRSRELGDRLLEWLQAVKAPAGYRIEVRGLGLMAGLELTDAAGGAATVPTLRVVKRLLARGYLVLPEGERGNVLGMTPPLTIGEPALEGAVRAIAGVLHEEGDP